jgi:hypothetical protein
MDSIAIALLILTTGLVYAAWQSWRLGNERRDVALLGGFAAASGTFTALAAVF